jgi:hypothetical protein
MLQRRSPNDPADELREQLVESRAVVATTVRVKKPAIEAALDAVYVRLCHEQGAMSAVEVVAFARERCPGIDAADVRFGLEQRLRRRGAEW